MFFIIAYLSGIFQLLRQILLLVSITSDPESQTIDADLVARVLAVATPREKEAISLVCRGYEAREIAEILGIARNTANCILSNFRAKARAVRDDREVIRCPQWERNKEKIQAYNRTYQQAHREELREKQRARDRTEEARERKRAYYAAHKEEINAKRRAKCAAKRAESQENAAPMYSETHRKRPHAQPADQSVCV